MAIPRLVKTAFAAAVLVFATGWSSSLQAQNTGRIIGTVTATATDAAVGGVNVTITELRIGNLTNADGEFAILNVPPGTHTLQASLIGYAAATQEVTVTAGGTATVNFTLQQTQVSLETIVVTGTAAEVRAKEIGNALDAILARDLEDLPVTNPENILGGRIPGLTMIQPGGQPGAGGTIRIRGQTTASQTVEPLIYVDGIRLYNLPISGGGESNVGYSLLQDINARDIERIEVVKGASATTLYGTEASGGVIQIFTKRGVSGTPIWSADITLGLANQGHVGPPGDPTSLYTKCSGQMLAISPSGSSHGEDVLFEDPTCPSSGNWFRNGTQQRYSLSVRGGGERVRYFVSGNYEDANGTLQTQRSRDGGLRANLDFDPTSNVSVQVNSSFQRRATRFVPDGNNGDGFLLAVGRGPNGNFKGGKGEDCLNVSVLCVTNRYLFDLESTATADHYTNGALVQFNPTDQLSNRIAVGWDFVTIETEDFKPFGFLITPGGFFNSRTNQRSKLSLDYSGSFRNDFGERFVSTFSWGGQLFQDRARLKFAETSGFSGPGKPTLESGADAPDIEDESLSSTNAGFFLQEIFGIDDRLFVTAGLRVDGNSAFGDDFGLQAYPKLSLAYVISEADFWPTDFFDTFKLRSAIGESGKAPGVFDKLRTWTPVTEQAGSGGFTPQDVGNVDVGPERTREFEAGFDASFYDGRAGVEATYYRTTTQDALVPVTLPVSNGFLASSIQNVGELEGRGYEFQLTGNLLRSDQFDWTVRANLGFNETKAVDTQGQVIDVDNAAEVREGHQVPVYVGNRVMNPNAFEEPMIESDQVYGPVNPTELFGFTSTFTLNQNVTLDLLVEHQGGGHSINYTGYQNSRRGAWQPCFDVQRALVAQENGNDGPISSFTALQRAKCRTNGTGGHNRDYWIEPNDFWKLRSLAVSYDLPARLIGGWANNVTVTLAGTNLWTGTVYHGLDPEGEDFGDRAENGIFDGTTDYGRREYYNLPAPRMFFLSFRVGF